VCCHSLYSFCYQARHKADKKINHASAHVVREGVLQHVLWKDIRVGDIVRVKSDEPVPADIIVLSSSGNNGVCHIETSNLDG
jgi:phospholipid-transporting ATPase